MSGFERLYLEVRKKEKRLYTDEEVMQLPYIDSKHIHFKEWVVRQASLKKLFNHLLKKQKPLKILDVGCGNGWMTNKLSKINGSTVIGVDVNSFEIEQAKRVFTDNKGVIFVCGSILEEKLFMNERFDVIVLAASIQYFSDLHTILNYLKMLLSRYGEIHALDSNFYTEQNIPKAKQASLNHYRALGYEEMAKYYHHHEWSSLKSFKFNIQEKPNRIIRFLTGQCKSFPWIIIRN